MNLCQLVMLVIRFKQMHILLKCLHNLCIIIRGLVVHPPGLLNGECFKVYFDCFNGFAVNSCREQKGVLFQVVLGVKHAVVKPFPFIVNLFNMAKWLNGDVFVFKKKAKVF